MQFRRLFTPSPTETSLGDTWTQSFVTSFLNFNHRQYESNHHKQRTGLKDANF